MANQVRCYCFINDNNVPVRGAIISCRNCNNNRVQFARTDIFGTAVFNLPDGDYLFRCECVPNFLTPSLAEYCVTLNNFYCSADLLFPCNLVSLNTTPINVTSNVTVNPTQQSASGSNVPFNSTYPNTPEAIARALGLNPSNTLSNNFMGNESPGFFPPSQTNNNPNTASQSVPLPSNTNRTVPQAASPNRTATNPAPSGQTTTTNRNTVTPRSPDRTGVSATASVRPVNRPPTSQS